MADNPSSSASDRDPYFSKAIQTHDQQIAAQAALIAQLQAEVAALKAKVK
jgi:hypothetical protein